MKKHFLDKPILRELFWFIVIPHNLKIYAELERNKEKFCDDNCTWLDHHPECEMSK